MLLALALLFLARGWGATLWESANYANWREWRNRDRVGFLNAFQDVCRLVLELYSVIDGSANIERRTLNIEARKSPNGERGALNVEEAQKLLS